MADTNKGTTTTSKVAVNAVDYSGEDAESIKYCAPDAADYTERKDYNRARKAYDNRVWELAHPEAAKVAKVHGKVTLEQAAKECQDISLADVRESMKATIDQRVADGAERKAATIAVLTAQYNYCIRQMARMDILLHIAESAL